MMNVKCVRHLRAARALLGLHQGKLAELAGVSLSTVNNIERQEQENSRVNTIQAIVRALEAEGVEFISDETGVVGLRLHKRERVRTVMIVGRDGRARKLYRSWISGRGKERHRIVEAVDVKEASHFLSRNRPDCVVVDSEVCDERAFEWIRALKVSKSSVPTVICSLGGLGEGIRRRAMGVGVSGCYDRRSIKEYGLAELVWEVMQ